jgi:hypothetical protein
VSNWPFVVAAYVVTFACSGALAAWAWLSMRKAEAAADALRKDK